MGNLFNVTDLKKQSEFYRSKIQNEKEEETKCLRKECRSLVNEKAEELIEEANLGIEACVKKGESAFYLPILDEPFKIHIFEGRDKDHPYFSARYDVERLTITEAKKESRTGENEKLDWFYKENKDFVVLGKAKMKVAAHFIEQGFRVALVKRDINPTERFRTTHETYFNCAYEMRFLEISWS